MTFTHDAKSQAAMTAEQALDALRAGNQRFREGKPEQRDHLAQLEATRGGQWPFAVVLSCIDSRLPAEVVFDQGIGDIFSARVAGNFVNEDILGSMEFGCKLAGAKLVVVMGHTHCGAIKGACDDAKLGNLTAMLAKLRPAVEATPEPNDPAQRNSGNPEFVREVIQRNVHLTLADLRRRSDVLREMEEAGEIRIVGALYDIESGVVDFLDDE